MRKLCVLVIIITLASCSSRKETISLFNSFLSKELCPDSLLHKKMIVIIPNEGCGGCISVAEDFYQRNCQRNDILFVFTNVLSLKNLKYKIQINFQNTIIDDENRYTDNLPAETRIYPCILYLSEGKVVKINYQSPKEEGFK